MKRRWMIIGGLVLLALLLVVSRCSGGGAIRDADVVIAPGSSLTAAARTLQASGAIASASGFLNATRLSGGHGAIKPGEYRITRGMSATDILRLLQSGKVIQRFVTIPEGLPAVLVQQRLMAAPLLIGPVAVPAEGSVLPDSYSYTRGEARSAVLARMQKAMQTAIANAWAKRRPTAVVKTPAEAITLASIVEKEVARPDERRLVAAVYSNRLRLGMPLQADPTVIYPVTKGLPLGRRILKSELAADDAYNTYRRTGLPPGPIANPSKEAIAAVLDPAPSDALYFVLQPGGHSAFTRSLAEHNANVARWYAYRRSRGEM